VHIRTATSADFPSIRDLDLGPGMTTERDTVYAVFFRLFPELCLVAEEEGPTGDGTLLGFALGALSSDRGEAYLHDLWVAPDQRGRGVGHRLMERFLAVGRELGARRASLVTMGAARYYEDKFGFARATATDDPYVPELERHRGFSVLILDLGGSAA
jgi:ribosomal protein S18 acetylase RimI-like enzyme